MKKTKQPPKKAIKPKRISSYNKLKAEIVKLQEDKIRIVNEIHILMGLTGTFMDKMMVEAKYKLSYNEEKMIWNGKSSFVVPKANSFKPKNKQR